MREIESVWIQCLSASSVTKFGNTSKLLLLKKRFWQFLLFIYQAFVKILYLRWNFFLVGQIFIVENGQILNKSSSRLVTLVLAEMRSLQTIQVPFVLKTELRSVRAFSTVTRLGYFWKVSGYFWKVSGYFWKVLAACFLAKIVQIFGHFQGLFLKIPLFSQICSGGFSAPFVQNWTIFYSNILSHWLCLTFERKIKGKTRTPSAN